MAEEKGRKKGDTNNPVMQICTADFKVKTGTGIEEICGFATQTVNEIALWS